MDSRPSGPASLTRATRGRRGNERRHPGFTCDAQRATPLGDEPCRGPKPSRTPRTSTSDVPLRSHFEDDAERVSSSGGMGARNMGVEPAGRSRLGRQEAHHDRPVRRALGPERLVITARKGGDGLPRLRAGGRFHDVDDTCEVDAQSRLRALATHVHSGLRRGRARRPLRHVPTASGFRGGRVWAGERADGRGGSTNRDPTGSTETCPHRRSLIRGYAPPPIVPSQSSRDVGVRFDGTPQPKGRADGQV